MIWSYLEKYEGEPSNKAQPFDNPSVSYQEQLSSQLQSSNAPLSDVVRTSSGTLQEIGDIDLIILYTKLLEVYQKEQGHDPHTKKKPTVLLFLRLNRSH